MGRGVTTPPLRIAWTSIPAHLPWYMRFMPSSGPAHSVSQVAPSGQRLPANLSQPLGRVPHTTVQAPSG